MKNSPLFVSNSTCQRKKLCSAQIRVFDVGKYRITALLRIFENLEKKLALFFEAFLNTYSLLRKCYLVL
jgi:hypothetical protein